MNQNISTLDSMTYLGFVWLDYILREAKMFEGRNIELNWKHRQE